MRDRKREIQTDTVLERKRLHYHNLDKGKEKHKQIRGETLLDCCQRKKNEMQKVKKFKTCILPESKRRIHFPANFQVSEPQQKNVKSCKKNLKLPFCWAKFSDDAGQRYFLNFKNC